MTKETDISGKKFNRLMAVKACGYKHGHNYWMFKCDCGNTTITRKSEVINGSIKSCGCLWDENVKGKGFHKKHLLSNERIYKIYTCMKERCYYKKNKRYNRYGGRGISVCEEWLNKKTGIENFYNWAIKNGYNDKLTIDRINNDGNYCPENCRWVLQKEQARNTSKNVYLEYNGEKRCVSEWSETTGICYSTIRNRIKYGWTVDRILTEPTHNKGGKNGK